MKNITLNLVFFFCAASILAQTIVSTTPENKNVILEEFTGMHCVYCPQGHAIAQAIQDNNPSDVYLINVHTGGYAIPNAGEPDFRTPFGAAIAGQSDLIGYPAGTVNRHYFPGQAQNGGTGTAMSRNQWTSASNQILAVNSYVNVGVEASIDVQTNELTVHVEAYYTGDSPESTNLLNVALLQNNTKGPQVGGGMGDNYNHMHRLVWMVTGQWGDVINNTTTGSFIDQTYTYTIPSDYNGVPVDISDLEIVAFVSETHQEIISGSGCYPTYTGIQLANDAEVFSIEEIQDECSDTITPTVTIKNQGYNDLTSLAITYDVNGTNQVYNWSGSISPLHSETIVLDPITFTLAPTNTLTITLPNDENTNNNELSSVFSMAPEATSYIDLELHTDNYGSEVRWYIRNSAGDVVEQGGPYGNNQTIFESFALTQDCYEFEIVDTYGDGGGAIILKDSNDLIIYSTNGAYGSGETQKFSTDEVLGVTDTGLKLVSMYPNPSNDLVTIKNAENANVEIYNLLGQQVFSKKNIAAQEVISVSNFETGTYFVKVSNEKASEIFKLLVTK